MRRGRRRTARRVKEDRTRGRRRRGGGQRGKRTLLVHVCGCVYECVFGSRMCGRECVCSARSRAGTTESTERNTEKTLVKGKRPLCLPFQSNRPPLSPLSFSLCPRFGSSCSLPAKSSLRPLSFSYSLSSTSHPLSFSLSPVASPPPGFLFVLPASSDLRLTHPEERENFVVLFFSLPPHIFTPLFSSHLFYPVYLGRAKEGSTKRAVPEGEQRRETGMKHFSFFALRSVYRFFSHPFPLSLLLCLFTL